MRELTIADRVIGPEHPPFVIAEAGINHDGNYDKAVQLVDAAAAAGADCIKFQCHIPDKEMLRTDLPPGNISPEPLWDIITRCALSEREERALQQYCQRKRILYLSTPFSREAADRLAAMDVPAFKIGSGECNNIPLVRHVASFGKPIILSTGMNNVETVNRTASLLREMRCPYALMQCTSMYPTPYDKVNLGAIAQLRAMFQVPIGLSDHSRHVYTCLGAIALGACLVEKHFTITRSWPGPDMCVSIEPDELELLVRGSKAIWQAREGQKTILAEEEPVIGFAYASVVTIRKITKGETFTLDNLWVKRPGTGPIRAADLDRLLGQSASVDIPADTFLLPQHVSTPFIPEPRAAI